MKEFYDFIFPYLKGRILDIGCGSGRDVEFFSSLGFEIEGVEASKKFFAYCKKKYPGLKFYNETFPFFDLRRKYDVITLVAVWMHLKKSFYLKAVKNLKKHLNEKGVVVLSYSANKREGFEFVNPKRLSYLFLREGFKKIDEKKFNDALKRDVVWITQIFEAI